MEMEILKENGKIKAKIVTDDFGTELLTMRNGCQWAGQPMTPELAKLTIAALQEYLAQ